MHTVQHRYDRNDMMLGGCSTCGHGYCNGLVFQILIWAGKSQPFKGSYGGTLPFAKSLLKEKYYQISKVSGCPGAKISNRLPQRKP